MLRFDYETSELLFNEYDLRSGLDNNRRELFKKVEEIPEHFLLNKRTAESELEKILPNYLLRIPTLNKARIHPSSEARKLDVSQDQNRAIIDRSQPAFINVTGVSFHVPYDGQKEFFSMRASQFSFSPPRAKLTDDELTLAYLIEGDEATDKIKLTFESDLHRIEEGLEWIRNDTATYNDDLIKAAKDLLDARMNAVSQTSSLLKDLGYPLKDPESRSPAPVEVLPSPDVQRDEYNYDFFVSYASEDKAEVAEPLVERLVNAGYRVWYAETELKMGDSLTRKIREGLVNCKFGVVILSDSFFKKKWPQHELASLFERQLGEGKSGVILPVWHGIKHESLAKTYPDLADLKAANTTDGLDQVISEIVRAFKERK